MVCLLVYSRLYLPSVKLWELYSQCLFTQLAFHMAHLAPAIVSEPRVEEPTRGIHPGTVRTNCATAAKTAGACPPVESAGTACYSLCGRAWRQVVWPAGAIRQLANHLPAEEPVVEERGSGPRVRAVAAGARGFGFRSRSWGSTVPTSRSIPTVPVREKTVFNASTNSGVVAPLPLVAAEARTAVAFRLSIGYAHDAP